MNRDLIVNFSTNTEGYEKFVEYYNDYKAGNDKVAGKLSFAEADKKMLKFFAEEIGRISGKKFEDYESNPMQYANFTDVREAAFAVVSVITDLIIPDTMIKDFGYIADVKNVAWGDTLKIEMRPRDLFVVSKGGRAKREFDVTTQYRGQKTIIPELHTFTVGVQLYDILIGRYTLAEFVAKVVASMETQMRYDIWNTFATTMETLSTSGDNQLRFTGYTQDDFVKLCQKVSAWNNAPAIAMGTKVALSKILPESTNYRYLLGDEYTTLGHVRDFFGTTVVELEQIADYTTEFKTKLADNKIYIVSPSQQKLVHVAVEGNTLTNTVGQFDRATLISTGTIMKSWGVGAASSAIAGVITLS